MKIIIEVPDNQDLELNVPGENNPVRLKDGDAIYLTTSGTVKMWSRIKATINECPARIKVRSS